MWTADGGIDGKTPVDLDELDLVSIEALPPSVWHRDMVDFAQRSATSRRAAGSYGPSKAGVPSVGSGTNCTTSIRTC